MSGLGSIGASLGSGNEPGGAAIATPLGRPKLGLMGAAVNTDTPDAYLPPPAPVLTQDRGLTTFQETLDETPPELVDFYQGRIDNTRRSTYNRDRWMDKWGKRIGEYVPDGNILTIPVNFADNIPHKRDMFKRGLNIVQLPATELRRPVNENAFDWSGGQGRHFAQGGIIEEMIGMNEPEPSGAMEEDDPVVTKAIVALDPMSPMSDEEESMALSELVEKYGQGAVEKLSALIMESKEGGMESDGLSDSVPASVGDEAAALSEGEFVLPADVVSHIGNGSTDSGARRLEELMVAIRKSRTGRPGPAPKIESNGIKGLVGAV